MKHIILTSILSLIILNSIAQSVTTFRITLNSNDIAGLIPIQKIDFQVESLEPDQSAGNAPSRRVQGIKSTSTVLELKRPFSHGSDWSRWIKDATLTPRGTSATPLTKTIIFYVTISSRTEAGETRNDGREKKLNDSGLAYPISYSIDDAGFEILKIKVINVVFN